MTAPPVLTGYEIVTDTAALTDTIYDGLTVAAPEGKQVLGGGVSLGPNVGGQRHFAVEGSFPVDDGTGWRGEARDISGSQSSGTITVWAICAVVDTELEICEAD